MKGCHLGLGFLAFFVLATTSTTTWIVEAAPNRLPSRENPVETVDQETDTNLEKLTPHEQKIQLYKKMRERSVTNCQTFYKRYNKVMRYNS